MSMKKTRWRLPLSALGLLFTAIMLWAFLRHPERESYSVTLTWNAPAPRPGITLIGYNVYRRTSEGGLFVRIAEEVSGPPYEDRLVNSGRWYVYVVTSVDKVGRESRFSAEVKAKIP
jgi:fibronectin type 3 domain-containing protein